MKDFFFFLLSNISHLFLEDKTYKNASLFISKFKKHHASNDSVPEQIQETAESWLWTAEENKVRYSSAAKTGSRLEGRVRIKARCFFSLNHKNKKEPSIKCIQYTFGSLRSHIQQIPNDGCHLALRQGRGYRVNILGKRARECAHVSVRAHMHMLRVNVLKHLTSQMQMFINLVTITCNFLLFSHKKWESYILDVLRLRGSYMLIGFLFLYPGQSNQLHLIKYNI